MSLEDRIAWLRVAILSPGVGGVLARGSLGSLTIRLAATGFVFAMHVLLARLLGVGSYGYYIYAITWVHVLSRLSTGGMDAAGARFAAEYSAQQRPDVLHAFLRFSAKLALAFSIFVALAMTIAVLALGDRLDEELAITFWAGAALLPLIALMEVRSGALRGLKRVVLARTPDPLRPVLVSLGVVVILVLARERLDAPVVMVLNILSTLAALAVVELVLTREVQPLPKRTHVHGPKREWVTVGSQLLLVSGFVLLLGQTDTLMLGAMRGTREAGIYAVASRLAVFTSFMLGAVNAIIAPQIAELHATGRRRELQRVLTLGARVSFGFALPVALVLWIAGVHVLGVFGSSFREGVPALVVLVAAQVVNCGAGAVGSLMTMTGLQLRAAWVFGASALFNIALNGLLIPQLGLMGAALATATTMVGWNVLLVVVAYRHRRLDPTILGITTSP
jgi:O-antigen/teichoic acid export membrane protein